MTTPAQTISSARTSRALSQAQLARMLSLDGGKASATSVSSWERGASLPSVRNAHALRRILGIEVPHKRRGRPLSEATVERRNARRSVRNLAALALAARCHVSHKSPLVYAVVELGIDALPSPIDETGLALLTVTLRKWLPFWINAGAATDEIGAQWAHAMAPHHTHKAAASVAWSLCGAGVEPAEFEMLPSSDVLEVIQAGRMGALEVLRSLEPING